MTRCLGGSKFLVFIPTEVDVEIGLKEIGLKEIGLVEIGLRFRTKKK